MRNWNIDFVLIHYPQDTCWFQVGKYNNFLATPHSMYDLSSLTKPPALEPQSLITIRPPGKYLKNRTLKWRHPTVTFYLVLNLNIEYWEPSYMSTAAVQFEAHCLACELFYQKYLTCCLNQAFGSNIDFIGNTGDKVKIKWHHKEIIIRLAQWKILQDKYFQWVNAMKKKQKKGVFGFSSRLKEIQRHNN